MFRCRVFSLSNPQQHFQKPHVSPEWVQLIRAVSGLRRPPHETRLSYLTSNTCAGSEGELCIHISHKLTTSCRITLQEHQGTPPLGKAAQSLANATQDSTVLF